MCGFGFLLKYTRLLKCIFKTVWLDVLERKEALHNIILNMEQYINYGGKTKKGFMLYGRSPGGGDGMRRGVQHHHPGQRRFKDQRLDPSRRGLEKPI